MRIPRVQLKLQGLMVACIYAAACLAGVLRPSPLSSSFLWTIQTCLLFASALWAILSQRAERAFWLGFAVFGWGYLGLNYLNWWSSPPHDGDPNHVPLGSG